MVCVCVCVCVCVSVCACVCVCVRARAGKVYRHRIPSTTECGEGVRVEWGGAGGGVDMSSSSQTSSDLKRPKRTTRTIDVNHRLVYSTTCF